MEGKGTILVFDDSALDVQDIFEALKLCGIDYEHVSDSDELLDIIKEIPEEPEIPWKYSGLSLDLKAAAPSSSHGNKFAGDWFVNEVLRSTSADNKHLSLAKRRRINHLPLSFLTHYMDDFRLERHRKAGSVSDFISKTDPRSIDRYQEWCMEVSEAYSIRTRYYDAGLVLCRILSKYDFGNARAMSIIRGGVSPRNQFGSTDLWEYVKEHFLPEREASPAATADRWELLCGMLADACAVFDDNLISAKQYLAHGMREFGGRSAVDIMETGSFLELVDLERGIDEKWGRT